MWDGCLSVWLGECSSSKGGQSNGWRRLVKHGVDWAWGRFGELTASFKCTGGCSYCTEVLWENSGDVFRKYMLRIFIIPIICSLGGWTGSFCNWVKTPSPFWDSDPYPIEAVQPLGFRGIGIAFWLVAFPFSRICGHYLAINSTHTQLTLSLDHVSTAKKRKRKEKKRKGKGETIKKTRQGYGYGTKIGHISGDRPDLCLMRPFKQRSELISPSSLVSSTPWGLVRRKSS